MFYHHKSPGSAFVLRLFIIFSLKISQIAQTTDQLRKSFILYKILQKHYYTFTKQIISLGSLKYDEIVLNNIPEFAKLVNCTYMIGLSSLTNLHMASFFSASR